MRGLAQRGRHLGFVHDPDIARAELTRHTRLVGALQQALVNLAVAFGFPREHAILDARSVHRQRLALLRLELGHHAPLPRPRGLELIAH